MTPNPIPVDEDYAATPFFRRSTNYQPNTFTESKQEFTQLEKKLVVLVINQIGNLALKGSIQPDKNLTFYIPFTELTKDRYDDIGAAADSLTSKKLSFINEKTNEFNYIVPFPQVQSVTIKGKRNVELTMFAKVVPHFAELGQRYTRYDIDVMLSLSSVYAQRLYEIVSMFQHTNRFQFRYSVERLRLMLNYPEAQAYNDFKKNALMVAQRELHNKAGINLDWTPSKRDGKRVIELEFSIKTTKQLAAEAVKQDQQQINKMPINEAVTTAWQLMKGYKLKDWQKNLIGSDPELLGTFLRVDSELGNGLRTNVKNPTAYLIKSLGIDQMKAPTKARKTAIAPKAPVTTSAIAPGPEVRFGKDQKLSDIIGNLFSGGK